MTVDEFVSRLERPRRSSTGWTARCPAHEDRTPSLSVREGDDGRVLVHCHAGCVTEKVCAAVGLRVYDLFPGEPIDWNRRFRPRTPEERQAADLRRLRRRLLVLELDQRRATRTMFRLAVIVAGYTNGDPHELVSRFWDGACVELDQEAAAEAEAAS